MKNNLSIKLAQPAKRALAGAGITSLVALSKFSEKEITQLHGIGANAMLEIKKALSANRLSFAKEKK